MKRCGLECLAEDSLKGVARFGHVSRRDKEFPLYRVRDIEAPGRRPRGGPKKTWNECVVETFQLPEFRRLRRRTELNGELSLNI